MIKNLLWSLLLVTAALSANDAKQDSLLIINMKNEPVLPNRFRTSKMPFKDEFKHVTRKGFDGLNISGSSQFSALSLEKIIETINWKNTFYVVDLRQESHGFINGDAVTWYTYRNWGNRGKTLGQIETEEDNLIKSVLTQQKINLYLITAEDKNATPLPEAVAVPTDIKNAYTEKTLARQLKVQYYRIPVTDHIKPTNFDIDRFVSFVKALPKNAWVHFHCSAGAGRTSTFMAMFDMMRNAKEITFDEIIDRQNAIGGKDLLEVNDTKPSKAWKIPYAEDRLDFLMEFYDYCKNNQDNFNTKWR